MRDEADAGLAIEVTERHGHAAELAGAAVARGAELVIAWGGDGTVNEVAGPLIGTSTALGVVPSGSGDGLARSLGLPRDPRHALRLAITGPRGPMDTGRLGDRHFLNIAGIGFDASVAAAFNRASRRGLSTYIRLALGGVWSYRCADYGCSIEDESRTGPLFLMAFANGREYGNGLLLAPSADPFDGLLDAVIVEGGPAVIQFWRARRLGFRHEHPAAGVTRQRITSARIEGDRLQCHVDGETFEASGTIEVAVRPSSIRVAGLTKAGLSNFEV